MSRPSGLSVSRDTQRRRSAQPSQADGRVQLGAADLHVEAVRLFQAAKIRRAEADHRLAEGDRPRAASESTPVLFLRNCCDDGRRTAGPGRGCGRSRASATAFGSTSWPPTPRQQAPALRKSAAVFRSTPPVGISRICGSGAAHRLEEGRPQHVGGEHLDDVGPGLPGGQDLGRREGAGHDQLVVALAEANHVQVDRRRDEVFGPGEQGGAGRFRIEDGAGAEQEAVAQGAAHLAAPRPGRRARSW